MSDSMTQKQVEAAETICAALFGNMVESLEARFADVTKLKHEVAYHQQELNQTLSADFANIVAVLQSVVNKFYRGYYEVQAFMPFSSEDFDYCYEHNKRNLVSIRKLMDFIS